MVDRLGGKILDGFNGVVLKGYHVRGGVDLELFSVKLSGTNTTPGWNQWRGILFGDWCTSHDAVLTNCTVRYGGQDGYDMVSVRSAATFTKTTFHNSYQSGLILNGNDGENTTLLACRFSSNRNGLRTINNGRFRQNEVGQCFEGNTACGVLVAPYTDGLGPLDLSAAWWGDPAGPSWLGIVAGDELCAEIADVSYLSVASTPSCDAITGTPDTPELPSSFVLSSAVPNPFNPSTTIHYELAHDSQVSLKVYNARGSYVTTLVEGFVSAGGYEVQWTGLDDQGSKVSSGVYFYAMQAGDFREVRKMVLLK